MAANFASTQYASAFHDLPLPDTDALRKATLEYLEKFEPKLWYDDPICSIVNGKRLDSQSSDVIVTKDALGRDNGHQHHATPSEVEEMKNHISSYTSPYTDLRDHTRRIEQKLLTTYAGFLIGNQCLDFGKQDGVTEMEESVMANAVERRLNDMVLEDELSGKISISRKPIYVSCVSNFTNFLDLFRKTVRCVELGIPCVILGRSNTVQHSYRWTELLVQLLEEEGVDPGMLTYLSCTLDDIKHVTKTCQEHTGNLYSTCSRALALSMMSSYPKTVSSTGGPNTLVTTQWTDDVRDAIRMSATIECAGQCTALRHAVIPDTVKRSQLEELFDDVTAIPSGSEALAKNIFDGVFAGHEGSPSPPGDQYTHHTKADAYFKISADLPGDGIDEYWRKMAIDFTQTKPDKEASIISLASWLNKNQPISLAINGPREKSLELGMSLFAKSGLVVYTVGSTDTENAPPALTCQARPQEAEVFGEFPPRMTLGHYTRFPVVVPSSTPSYGSTYTTDYLESKSLKLSVATEKVQGIIQDVTSKTVQGFCVELIEYLMDATKDNPKRGVGTSRTALWGLQRPPLLDGQVTCIRCTSKTQFVDIAPAYLLFFATTARSQVQLSVDPSNTEILSILKKHGLPALVETDESFGQRTAQASGQYYNIVRGNPMLSFPMVGHFVSLYFPLGHIKSTMSGDDEFVSIFKTSQKWLKMHD